MATPTRLTHHRWIRQTVEGVDVIVDPFTGSHSVIERSERSVGEVVGCAACGEPLTDGSATTGCPSIDTAA